MNYIIRKVETKLEKIQFNKLPFKIYGNDENWVPHVIQDVEYVFDKNKNKYFNYGVCERWILHDEKNQIIGRIAAFINKKKAFTFDQPTGGLGFFECINDEVAANKLFDIAVEWLTERGMEAVDGPINFGENNKFWGLLIENFEFPTYQGQNYNPPYYVDFFKNYGFKIYFNQLINFRKIADPFPEKYRLKAKAILQDKSFHIEVIKKNNLIKYSEDFRTVYNLAWGTHDNFKKMNADLAASIFKKMKPIIDEDLVFFAYYNNKPIAFCMGLPDINPIIKRIKGNLNVWGKIKFMLLKRFVKIERINGVALGVLPDYQKKGVEAALFQDLANRIQGEGKSKYKEIVVTWVGDFNPKMQHIFEDVGFRVVAKMATFRKLFDPNKPFKRSPIIEK